MKRVAILGAGRAGLGLASALRRARVPFSGVVAHRAASVRRARRLLGARLTLAGPAQALERAGVIVLCVPDAAIASCAASLPSASLRGKVVLHTSGATDAAALAPLRRHGAAVGSMHPLIVFPLPGRGAIDLAGVIFAVDGDAAARRAASALARALGGRPVRLTASRRGAYHLAAALAANGLVSLMDFALEVATRRAGLAPREARAALVRLARSSLAALDHDTPRRALTGPAARGDAATLRRHLEEVRRAHPDAGPLYRLLSRRAILLARADGRLTASRAAALRRLIGGVGGRRPRRGKRSV